MTFFMTQICFLSAAWSDDPGYIVLTDDLQALKC